LQPPPPASTLFPYTTLFRSRTIQFAMELDPETIQVSMSHPYPGTEFDAYLKKHNYAVDSVMTDEEGHQLPVFQYPGLSRKDIMQDRKSTRLNSSHVSISYAV